MLLSIGRYYRKSLTYIPYIPYIYQSLTYMYIYIFILYFLYLYFYIITIFLEVLNRQKYYLQLIPLDVKHLVIRNDDSSQRGCRLW